MTSVPLVTDRLFRAILGLGGVACVQVNKGAVSSWNSTQVGLSTVE